MNKDMRAFLKLKESWRRIDGLYDLYAKSMGLNFTAILILELLREPGVHTQKELCKKLGLPKQLINTVIKSFWEQSYVVLKEAKDRRNKEIRFTDEGIKYAEKILRPLQEMDDKALENFTADELLIFTAMTEKYEKSFEMLLKEFMGGKDNA
jgi:DNA-binding MarR family transcriptional regulator